MDAAIASVVAHPALGPVNDGFVVNVANVCNIHVHHGAIVEEATVIPASACKALAKIPEAVVDAAIETDLRAPVAVVKNVAAVSPRPVWWSPQVTDFWS